MKQRRSLEPSTLLRVDAFLLGSRTEQERIELAQAAVTADSRAKMTSKGQVTIP